LAKYDTNSNFWAFSTAGSEAMRIDSSGNVGIGTASPGNALTIARGAGTSAYIQTASGSDYSLWGQATGTGALAGTFTALPFLFYTNSSERMRIDSSGNLGIGTSSPAAPLQIGSSTNQSDGKIILASGNGVNLRAWSIRTPYGGANVADPNYGFVIRDETGAADRLSISYSTGNIGIKTNSPTVPLSIGPAPVTAINSHEVLQLNSNSSYADCFMSITDSTAKMIFGTTSGVGFVGSYSNHPWAFRINNLESARLSTAGNFLINTTNDYGRLFVNQTANNTCAFFSLDTTANQAGTTAVRANISTVSNYIMTLEYNGIPKGTYTTDGTNIIYNAASNSYFATGGTTRMIIDSSGNVGIGTTTPATKLNVYSSTAQSDAIGFVQIENPTAANAVNSSYTAKNYSGTSQFMQWENYGVRIGSRIVTNSGAGGVYFTYGSDVVGMKIDGSGRVTIPNHPAFMVGISATSDATVAVNSYIPFNSTAFNTGSYFNTSTYKFTAPVAGVYSFTFNLFYTNSSSSTQSMQAGIYVNGGFVSIPSGDAYGVGTAIPNSAGGTIEFGTTVLLSLNANDTVGVAARDGAGIRIYQGHSNFSGFLVG
jgi:hypothetical protein